MNPVIVVDASVSLKWVLAEEHAVQAQALLAQCHREGLRIAVPPHLLSEVGNALYQRLRRRHLTSEEAVEAYTTFLQLPLDVLRPAQLYEQSFSFAQTYQLPSVYDSLYVVLAHQLGTTLWTADQRLLNTVGSRVPWVQSIAAYPLDAAK